MVGYSEKNTRMKFIKEPNQCGYCREILFGHPRCENCAICLHAKDADYVCVHCNAQHTLISKDGVHCAKCLTGRKL